jgi:hypothetical protein
MVYNRPSTQTLLSFQTPLRKQGGARQSKANVNVSISDQEVCHTADTIISITTFKTHTTPTYTNNARANERRTGDKKQ